MSRVLSIIFILFVLFLYKVNTDEYLFTNEFFTDNLYTFLLFLPFILILLYLIDTNENVFRIADELANKIEKFFLNLFIK